jgi:hypothetical protein
MWNDLHKADDESLETAAKQRLHSAKYYLLHMNTWSKFLILNSVEKHVKFKHEMIFHSVLRLEVN